MRVREWTFLEVLLLVAVMGLLMINALPAIVGPP